ncbi:MAG: DUF1320 domain-containing protein [Thauera sp.]
MATFYLVIQRDTVEGVPASAPTWARANIGTDSGWTAGAGGTIVYHDADTDPGSGSTYQFDPDATGLTADTAYVSYAVWDDGSTTVGPVTAAWTTNAGSAATAFGATIACASVLSPGAASGAAAIAGAFASCAVSLAVAGAPAAAGAADGKTLSVAAELIPGHAAGAASGEAPGATLITAAAFVPSAAAGQAACSGATVSAGGALVAGAATGSSVSNGHVITQAVTLIPGAVTAGGGVDAPGAIIVAAASIAPGVATGGAAPAGAVLASAVALISGAAAGAAAASGPALSLGASLLPGAAAVGVGATAPGATVIALADLAAGAASGAASVPAHIWQAFLALIAGSAAGETAADPAGAAPGAEFAAFLALIVGEASGVVLDEYPMKYATLADMVTRFGQAELVQLTDTLHRPPTTIDTTRVQIAIHDAQMEVDSAIGRIYRLPLAGCVRPPVPPATEPSVVAPPQLTRLTCDIARYFLYDDAAPEHEVVRRYKQAWATLDDLASGTLQLACPWGGSPGELIAADAQSGSAEVYDFFAPRQITDDALRGF